VNPAVQVVEPTREIEEAALLARARDGDAAAVDALVRKHLGDVYAITFRLLGDRDLAQDAAQDALVGALNGLHRFRGASSFRTWLIRIAVNAARSAGRRQTRRREVSLEAVAGSPAAGVDAATLAAGKDEAARAALMLTRLPEKQRMAVSLRIHQGLSYKEISEALDCTEGAARVNYHLGLKRLRELMI
jgi:RNA polymerase sigma-70 factor, ECF subfamily